MKKKQTTFSRIKTFWQKEGYIDVSKIDVNRCKQTQLGLPCFWAYRYSQFTVIMNQPQNTACARGSEYVSFTCL